VTRTKEQNVVDLLMAQHEQIKGMFSGISNAQGTQKRELFEDLVRLLAVHESAEEEVVHPVARRRIENGEQIAEGRRQEEDKAKHELAQLYDMGVDHPDFDQRLSALASAVIEHAEREEHEEFGRLRESLPEDQLRRLAGAVRAAEATAPTRPHPNTGESPAANMLAGPPLAVFDRVRDRVRDWRESDGRS
jgi:hemerythrin superfamily protein